MSPPIQASIRETAFVCPHCSAFTTQFWYVVYADQLSGEKPVPHLAGEEHKQLIQKDQNLNHDERKKLLDWLDKLQSGLLILDAEGGKYADYRVYNIHLSSCYNCKKIAVWVYDRLLFPTTKSGVLPNPDLPDDILRDFEEAREIVNSSPRGAAALLRLCIQKLCKHLKEKGKSIDDDIASLVKKGLNPLVQKSLDVVRVIGNEAVHPGVLDLKDDLATALRLFDFVNSIADQMISHPKVVSDLYEKLPESKRKAIEARDGKSPQP